MPTTGVFEGGNFFIKNYVLIRKKIIYYLYIDLNDNAGMLLYYIIATIVMLLRKLRLRDSGILGGKITVFFCSSFFYQRIPVYLFYHRYYSIPFFSYFFYSKLSIIHYNRILSRIQKKKKNTK